MYKLVFILALVMYCPAIITHGTAHLPSYFRQLNQKPDIKFDSLWVNHNIWQGGLKGMLIHLKFTVYDLRGVDCKVDILFFDPDEEMILKDKNQKYHNNAGNVAVQTHMQPKYKKTEYKDLQLFMPYDELHLPPGKYELTMDVALSWGIGIFEYEQLTFYDFTYTQPLSGAINSSKKNDVYLEKFNDYPQLGARFEPRTGNSRHD